MFISRVAPHIRQLCRATGALQTSGQSLRESLQPVFPSCYSSLFGKLRHYSTAADNTQPPQRWVALEPELDEYLIPRKLSVSPLESWLSLRYSLPPLLEASLPIEEGDMMLDTKVLPPLRVPLLEEGDDSVTPLSCKNVLEIRRRKMNRHKYKKLMKRTKFLRRRVLDGRRKKKQKRFEKDLERIWMRAGLKKAPEGWNTPKIFIKQYKSKRE